MRGAKTDANGPYLARELTRLGLEPERLLLVGDRVRELEATIREGLSADLLVVSGGLGPTHDDRTVELLAAATGRPLVVDAELEREIEARARSAAARLGRPYADFEPGVRKQASLPAGGRSLGLAGTAPAVVLEHDEGVAVALPGPPAELRRLWPAALASEPMRRIAARAPVRSHRVLRFFGPSESAVARVVAAAGGEGDGLEVTVCAAELEVQVDVLAEPAAEPSAAELERVLRTELGYDLFADDERPLAAIVLDLCRAGGLTLATAESCTGGLVAQRLTAVPGSSDVFLGAIVAYSNDVKERRLRVPRELLRRHGAVSAEAARAMAAGARAELGADVAVGVTGIAGPGGGTDQKPVGLVHVAACAADAELARELRLPGGREEIRARAATVSLHLVRTLLTQMARDPRDSGA